MEWESENAIASIRQKSRKNDQASRSKNRKLAFNSRRVNLNSIAKSLQIPSKDEVSSLSAQLKQKKKDPEILRKLSMGLSAGGESVTAFLNTKGALYALIGCFTGNDEILQKEAMYVVINLGLGTEKQCEQVYKGIARYMLREQISIPYHLKDPYAWIIGNLCGGNEKVCEDAMIREVPTMLCDLLESREPHIVQSAAYALTHFYVTDACAVKAVGLIKIAQNLLDNLEKADESLAEISALLFVLTSEHLMCEHLIIKDIIRVALCALEKLINRQSLDVASATYLLRILMNCVGAFPDSAELVCDRAEQFVSVSKFLLYSPHPHLRSETMQMIANVINGASQTEKGRCAIETVNLRPKLESAVRSALAGHFTNPHELSTNFVGVM